MPEFETTITSPDFLKLGTLDREMKRRSLEKDLDDWISNTPDPDFSNLPEELALLLLPEAAIKAASSSENLRVLFKKVPSGLTLSLVELDSPMAADNINKLMTYNETAARREDGEEGPEKPEELRPYGMMKAEISQGIIDYTDEILFTVLLKKFDNVPEAIHVTNYDGRKSAGIGKDFYLKRLPGIARKLGYKYITGKNNAGNIDYFREKLNRLTYNELPEDLAKKLFPDSRTRKDQRYNTVFFINDIDREKAQFDTLI